MSLKLRSFLKPTPSEAISRLAANDANLTVVDLSNSAVMQLKGAELMPMLADALCTNTVCQELILSGCGVDDAGCAHLARALPLNASLAHLNLENNRVHNEGAIHLASALARNRSVVLLNLLSQKGSRFGDSALSEFLKMFDSNVTLLKIVWRLESRQSFRLTKLITRNNEIDRLTQTGKEYTDLLPAGAEPLSDELRAQRAAVIGRIMGTPRVGAAPRDATRARSDENVAANSQPGGARALAAKLGFGGAKACERTAPPHAAEKAADAPDGPTPQPKSSVASQENTQPKNPMLNSNNSVPSKSNSSVPSKSNSSVPSKSNSSVPSKSNSSVPSKSNSSVPSKSNSSVLHKSNFSVPSQSSKPAPSQESNLVASRKLLFSSARESEPKPFQRPVLRSALTVPSIATQPSSGSDPDGKEAEPAAGAHASGAQAAGAVRDAVGGTRGVARRETLKRQLEALDAEEKEALAQLRGEFARRRQQLLFTR